MRMQTLLCSIASQGLRRMQASGILELPLSKRNPDRMQLEAKNDLSSIHNICKSPVMHVKGAGQSEKRLVPEWHPAL